MATKYRYLTKVLRALKLTKGWCHTEKEIESFTKGYKEYRFLSDKDTFHVHLETPTGSSYRRAFWNVEFDYAACWLQGESLRALMAKLGTSYIDVRPGKRGLHVCVNFIDKEPELKHTEFAKHYSRM